jgi:mannose-6-phosphate isomerase-like protein (cupin superfamily)
MTVTTQSDDRTAPQTLGPHEGEIMKLLGGLTNRWMIDGNDSGGHFALCEHRMTPRTLAAPLHLHTAEDEYTYVLEGRIGARLGGEEIVAEAGDLIFKPRGEWHTFWNAGDGPLRVLEIIAPAGFEKFLRELGELAADANPAAIAELFGRYGGKVDFEATMPIIERHGLAF